MSRPSTPVLAERIVERVLDAFQEHKGQGWYDDFGFMEEAGRREAKNFLVNIVEKELDER